MINETHILTLADGYPFDIIRMLEGRGLATASSGGGKSWLLRRIIEQVLAHAPNVQVMVIDPEGEFHTLREKFDLLVCAPADADAVATPATAPLLVRHLLEAGTSAVFNIYDLKAHERQAFVRAFCEAMVNAKRELWRNVLVVIDEAHIFCPEGAKSESGQAVIDLATRGRKRGFGLLLATQRLAKLHKDAAGEMLNKFIGRTSLINDIKRAADELGETQKEMSAKLKGLGSGEWFAYGPALPDGVHRLKVGPVVTTHPQPGARRLERPIAPGPKIRALLEEKLKDLPQQAKAEAVTVDQLRAQLEESREVIRRLAKQQGQAGISEAQVKDRINQAVKIAEDVAFNKGVELSLLPAIFLRERLDEIRSNIDQIIAGLPKDDNTIDAVYPKMDLRSPYPELEATEIELSKEKDFRPVTPQPTYQRDGISAPQQRLLDVLAQFDTYGNHQLNRTTLAVQSGVSSKSSGFRNNLSVLRSAGLIDYPDGDTVRLTDQGRSAANHPTRARTLIEYHEQWFQMVSNPQAAILRHLISNHPGSVSRSNLAKAVNASENSSGYRNSLSVLRTMGAIEYLSAGQIKASAILFPQGVKK